MTLFHVKLIKVLNAMSLGFIFLGGAVSYAGDDPIVLRQEIESLKTNQQAIQKELKEIKEVLEQLRPPPPILTVDLKINIAGAPTLGDPQAPLTLVEFSDFECPFCARYFQATWPQLKQEYVRTGKIRYVFRDLPLEHIHKNASKAAEAAHCAGEQDQYWPMHDRLFAHQKALALDELPKHAEAVGLVLPEFKECLDSGRHAEKIRQSLAEGKKAGIRGTPTFFVGLTNGEGSTLNAKRRIWGALPFSEFQKVLNGLLAERAAAK